MKSPVDESSASNAKLTDDDKARLTRVIVDTVGLAKTQHQFGMRLLRTSACSQTEIRGSTTVHVNIIVRSITHRNYGELLELTIQVVSGAGILAVAADTLKRFCDSLRRELNSFADATVNAAEGKATILLRTT